MTRRRSTPGCALPYEPLQLKDTGRWKVVVQREGVMHAWHGSASAPNTRPLLCDLGLPQHL